MHRCDNTLCVNPDHLTVGTHGDNFRDMHRKGRSRNGERHSRTKLTRDDVRVIRSGAEMGMELKILAERFHVSRSNIEMIVSRRTWRHI